MAPRGQGEGEGEGGLTLQSAGGGEGGRGGDEGGCGGDGGGDGGAPLTSSAQQRTAWRALAVEHVKLPMSPPTAAVWCASPGVP